MTISNSQINHIKIIIIVSLRYHNDTSIFYYDLVLQITTTTSFLQIIVEN